MSEEVPFYAENLAYIHDVGFGTFASNSASGLLQILSDCGIRNGLVVDLGCGSGIWAQKLTEAGYHVVGIDVSPAMIELARSRAPSAEFVVGSVWDFPIPSCRAITALGEVVCYRNDTDPADLTTLFSRIFSTLEPGGVFIFDVVLTSLGRNYEARFAEGDDWACLVHPEYDESRQLLTRHITSFRRRGELFHRSRETHIQQLYEADQITHWLQQTGFHAQQIPAYGEQPMLPHRAGFVAYKST